MSVAIHLRPSDEELPTEAREAAEPFIDLVEALSRTLEPDELRLLGERLRALVRERDSGGADRRIAQVGGTPLAREERVEYLMHAMQRGFARRRELLEGALTAPRVAELIGWSRQTPHDRRKAGRMLGVRSEGAWRFPPWQLDPDAPDGVLEGLPAVLSELADRKPYQQLLWLTSEQPQLGGRTPVELLQLGDVDPVRLEARAVGVT